MVTYVVTYSIGVHTDNRNALAKLLSDQIQFLYGPLYSLQHASTQAWLSFSSRHRPGRSFFGSEPDLSQDELASWRIWMTEVFMPLNLQMEAAIVANAHLIEGATMPKEFLDLLAHVEVYRVVLGQWKLGNYSDHTSYIEYPKEFGGYVDRTFKKLTDKQAKLLGPWYRGSWFMRWVGKTGDGQALPVVEAKPQ
jgi:hypothetical protein